MPTITQPKACEPTQRLGYPAKANPYAESVPETVLLERCKAGEPEAWNRLVRQHRKTIFNFAFSLCRNTEEAEDIVGQVYLQLYQNIHTFRQESRFSSWLYRIVQNAYLDLYVRSPHASGVSLDVEAQANLAQGAESATISPEQICLEHERARLLEKEVNYLPDHQRQVMQMYHTEGKSYEEIAALTGLSVGTVKSRLNRARAALRERLEPQREMFLYD